MIDERLTVWIHVTSSILNLLEVLSAFSVDGVGGMCDAQSGPNSNFMRY